MKYLFCFFIWLKCIAGDDAFVGNSADMSSKSILKSSCSLPLISPRSIVPRPAQKRVSFQFLVSRSSGTVADIDCATLWENLIFVKGCIRDDLTLWQDQNEHNIRSYLALKHIADVLSSFDQKTREKSVGILKSTLRKTTQLQLEDAPFKVLTTTLTRRQLGEVKEILRRFLIPAKLCTDSEDNTFIHINIETAVTAPPINLSLFLEPEPIEERAVAE
jgi:hypothetical protein